MTAPLNEILARVPLWQGRNDVVVSFLSGGITNQNYRVDTDGKSFVLRLNGARTELLGIDRRTEYAAQAAAASIGIAPDVIAFLEPEGYLITCFIRAHEIPPREMRSPQMLRRVADVLKRVHALPALRGTFSPFQVVRDYDHIARAHGITNFPTNYVWLREQMDEIEQTLARAPMVPVPCHNDLLNGNFLMDEQGIRILDWEYAGMGDPFFDLANFSAHHELDEAGDRILLDVYFGRVTGRQFARLQLMKAMSDFREAMWGVVQQGISQLDFDFRGYANQFFDRLTTRVNAPNYHEIGNL